MTEANEMCATIMRELNNLVNSDTEEGETKEEQESFSFYEEEASGEIPQSLLSYFATSKSRAAVCEKLILEELEDLPASHHAKDMRRGDPPTALYEDMMTPNEPVTRGTENEENNTFADTRLLLAPTETEALFTHNVSVCHNKEDEAGTDECTECEQHLAPDATTLVNSPNEEKRKKSSEYEVEREKRRCEEMEKEERRRQREKDFQEELRKIMEAEKLHQKELELMGKRAQEKLEQELLIQQELISNLQRRVAEERKIKEEEWRRMKEEKEKKKKEEEERRKREEENRRKREEVKRKTEAERKRMEEEMRRMKEEAEKRKIEEDRLKGEEERRKKQEEWKKREEEEKRRIEEEEMKKKEEERHKMELEKKKLEDEMRRLKEEEERNKRIKKEEEERRKVEVARKKFEEEKNGKMEEEMRLKKEEEWRKKEEEERKRREEKNVRIEEEVMMMKEKQEEMRKEKEEDDRKKIEAEGKMYDKRKKGEKEHRTRDEEIRHEERTKKAEEETKTREEEEERKCEKKINMMEEEVRGMEEEDRKLEEDKRTKEEDEKRKKKDERKTKKEERRRQEEEMRRQREEEDYGKTQVELRLIEEKDAHGRKMEPERKNKNKEKKREEEGTRKMEDEPEERRIKEEVRENKEGRRLRDEDDGTKFKIQGEEKAQKLIRENKLQEKKRENERENTDNTENSQTSSSPAPLHSECPTITETVRRHDPSNNISQSSVCATIGQEDPAIRPSTSSSSGSLLLCLPEQTEQKRLSWMKDCIPWSKLSLQNRRKQRGSVRSWRGPKRVAEASSLPPLCPDTLLQSTGWKSLKEVTTVTLEDLPSCSLSTLAQCRQLRSLTLRRCGLKALEGVNQLPELCYIDVQENDISFVDCENMSSLRVLRLGHNSLMSIHGLSGADNLAVLDLSYNSITRIAGLESLRRLQRLSVDHNQLISTKGLRDIYTLLHLDCSHNHLVSVEGLENSALLNTLDLTANSLAEPPSLNNQVLLRELRLDDNSISSLRGLSACWLPLMQILSVAQNRITQLPSMSDFVSLANVDLRFNCLSELKNVCESLEGCQFLQEVHLVGNPLEQESGWRSTMQKAVPGLRAIDGQETDSFLSPPAVQQVSLASGSFLMFCQAQLQQTRDLQQQRSEELSNALLPLDTVKTSCRHFAKALQLAEDQRFAHEYGDTSAAADRQGGASQTTPDRPLDEENSSAGKLNERPQTESAGKVSPLIPREDSIRGSYWTFEENLAAESWHGTLDTVTAGPEMKSAVSEINPGMFHSFAIKGEMTSANLKKAAVSNHQDLDLENTAAVVIQQQWRKHRQKCGNIISPPTAEKGGGKGGDGGKQESGPSCIKWNVVGRDHAATVIQAFWRGFALRRRLTSALAAVTCPHTREDDTFEEVDMDEFVFDEAALEKDWTLPLSEDSPPRCSPVSEQSLSQKPLGPFPESSQYILPPPPVWRPKQAWLAREQVDCAGQRVSPESFDRSKSPASASMLSGVSKRSEKILEEWGFTDSHTALLMLKRAEKMKAKKQQQKKHLDPSIRLALFRNCTYQLGPVEARNRPASRNRSCIKVREAELGLQRAEKTEEMKEEWMRAQASRSDRSSESERFLPEISSDILNGGRVQLVAEPGYTELLHHASGSWANSSLAARPRKENNYPRRNSLGHAKKEVPSPKRVTSAPSKKERISFRDHQVQLSGGWGGGKKRDKVHK